jgi:hypothetical protein
MFKYNMYGKTIKLERTANPQYFKAVIDADNTFKCFSFWAVNFAAAMYHTEIVALGVR